MAAARDPLSAVRVSFQLGPWRSPRSQGWLAAYDRLVERLAEAGVAQYGVLEAELAGGPVGTTAWRRQFATNAAWVFARYMDRIPTFEVLPGPNRQTALGKPRISPGQFAHTLAAVYERIKDEGEGRHTVLVLGALSLANDGLTYLDNVLTRGQGSDAWERVGRVTHAHVPFDALAVWLDLPAVLGSPSGHFRQQVDATLGRLAGNAVLGHKPLYVSGFTWPGSGGEHFQDSHLESALVDLARYRPAVRYAVHDAALTGPLPPTQRVVHPSVVGAFAIFAPEPPRAVRVEAADAVTAVARGFDFPVGPRDHPQPAPGFFSAAGLVDDEYFRLFNAWHTGEDWNGPGGCDADLGLPVFASADGVVVAAGFHRPSWGYIVLIQHTLPGGIPVWTQYAHLREHGVSVGQGVKRGQPIGTIGKGADDAWCAHLHFEVRNKDLPPNNWFPFVSSKQRVLDAYLGPSKFIRAHRPGMFQALGIIVDSEPGEQADGTFIRSATPFWRQSYFGWNGSAIYTFASQSESETGEWRPRLPHDGRYRVEAWIPSYHATTRNAVYTVQHTGGTTTAPLNQSIHNDDWVPLGTFEFRREGGVVRLTDKTGEPDDRRLEVCFDALRWLPA